MGVWNPPPFLEFSKYTPRETALYDLAIHLCPMSRSRKLAQYFEYHSKENQNERCIGHKSGNALQPFGRGRVREDVNGAI